ncbi:hypothetical protein ACI2UK_24460 [Ralstonia nicotianae]|uniref:hypothetical protein n=1 Tax=Ralstonia pseudosolanacearum TaxID=1310165 RepID=UPI002004ED57|nr:hypothetical protein [Ralstonia pseudosolanacearum]MCK4120406.1 hypothetical protein [Ralstonia pseudosolanacearum]
MATHGLSEYDRKILAVLDTTGGYTTADVAKHVTPVFADNRRMHSAAVRSWLVQLERKGLVKRLDDLKPVCWVKVDGAAI